jgi:hypothetical protein
MQLLELGLVAMMIQYSNSGKDEKIEGKMNTERAPNAM